MNIDGITVEIGQPTIVEDGNGLDLLKTLESFQELVGSAIADAYGDVLIQIVIQATDIGIVARIDVEFDAVEELAGPGAWQAMIDRHQADVVEIVEAVQQEGDYRSWLE